MDLRIILPKTSWYLRESAEIARLQAKTPISVIRDQEHDYQAWWEAKWCKQWNDRVEVKVVNEVPRQTILKPEKVIGTKDGHPVILRSILASSRVPDCYNHAWDAEVKVKSGAAPALYVVSYKGKRVDAFLTEKRARECAKRFLQAE